MAKVMSTAGADPSKAVAAVRRAGVADLTDGAAGAAAGRSDADDPNRAHLDTLAAMPRDVGWYLLLAGLVTELGMPGIPPIWIFGLLILWPRGGAPLARGLRRRFPRTFDGCLSNLERYIDDLERRYPSRSAASPSGASRNG